ncbi:MAG TPA: lamin tail domain-containing protein [Candidatus Saccharibacteria bacterium]|nr:lamin tail domain-containing protein [Candidatus Saccharibacteria bacterium]
MNKLYFLKLFFSIFSACLIINQPLFAVSTSLVISQVKTGDSISAKNEFVEIYNNSDIDQEISDWCIYYQSISLVKENMSCFYPSNANSHIFVPSKSYILAVSNQLIFGDMQFSYTLSGTGGYVILVDNDNNEIDQVGWGISSSDQNLSLAPSSGKVLNRKLTQEGYYQDTDSNIDDFEIIDQNSEYHYGNVYEVEDICSNLEGIQTDIPVGFEYNDNYECIHEAVDICMNIDGLQDVLPDGFEINSESNCIQHDECSNLEGIQEIIPEGYEIDSDNLCKKIFYPINITELLPNAIGTDDGNEFIELYNPNSFDINLDDYELVVGGKTYNFPQNSIIKSYEYASFYDDDMKFTLVNTSSEVLLKSIDDSFLGDTISYMDAEQGLSWTLVDNIWQYSNQSTPGRSNLASLIINEFENSPTIENKLKPCPEGQERNPETNRCRKIVASPTLVPCKQGQYRDEQTNRCRNIVSDVVAYIPCPEGQERNPETNRCRTVTASVLGLSTTLKPCPEGQERNPETNRCRKIVSVIPTASFATEKTTKTMSNPLLWWSIAGVGIIAVGYGFWEWRKEIRKFVTKIINIFIKSK